MAEQHKSPHVLLFPFPLQGHLNPMIQFAKRLLSKGVKTTLVTTVYNSNCILSHNNTITTSITIGTISDGFDDGGYAEADNTKSYLKTFHEVGSKTLASLINKLNSEGNTVDAIVYDSFVTWALDVAMEFGIDSGCFFTQACGVNCIYYHVYKGLVPVPIEAGSTVSVPGLPLLEHWETPAFIQNPEPYPGWSDIVFNQFSNIDHARWVFSNTFYKLEEEVIKWMRKMWRMKMVGPTLPSLYLDKRLEDDIDYGISIIKPNIECMKWLNDKPKGSVVYIAFGSWVEVETEQMEEIAWALKESNVNFLWVVREPEEKKLPKQFVDGITKKGLVVAWCRQLEVLAQESIGCFITHCGLNSILEAISMGVPIVGMPQWTDQTTNAKLVEDVWGVGLRVRPDDMGIVRGGNILSCIKEIMEGERGIMAKNNANKWRDLAKEAIDEGGSSDKDIDDFVYELKHT